MNQPPKVFTTICNIIEMSTDKIVQAWLDVSEKVINEFIGWLVNDSDLTEDQFKSLESVLLKVTNSQTSGGNKILDLVAPTLNEDQKNKATNMYADLFVKNLDGFYTGLKETMTLEQKQVADSYTKTSYA